MDKSGFIKIMNDNLKLVREEFGLTQEKMAAMIGISKKSLVESEKGRRSLSWNEAALLACIFSGSSVIRSEIGEDAQEIVEAIAFSDCEVRYPSTMGGKIWWKVVEAKDDYKIQQNLVSNHYRLLDGKDRRLISSFDLEEVRKYLEEITR